MGQGRRLRSQRGRERIYNGKFFFRVNALREGKWGPHAGRYLLKFSPAREHEGQPGALLRFFFRAVRQCPAPSQVLHSWWLHSWPRSPMGITWVLNLPWLPMAVHPPSALSPLLSLLPFLNLELPPPGSSLLPVGLPRGLASASFHKYLLQG